jgi:MoaA/NifB/PqqE/SkfB family radical SAM enzyme
MKDYCKDVVAEVTVMREDQHLLYRLVKYLSKQGINSDVTFIDIAKTRYYDFSNVSNPELVVNQSPELANQMMNILIDEDIDVHMKNYLIPETYKILPSNMDCEIEKGLHNVTIDADGTVRLCLRIRGIHTPQNVMVTDLIDLAGHVNPVAHRLICKDKAQLCKLCNHTCHLMSKVINQKNLGPEELVHLDRR